MISIKPRRLLPLLLALVLAFTTFPLTALAAENQSETSDVSQIIASSELPEVAETPAETPIQDAITEETPEVAELPIEDFTESPSGEQITAGMISTYAIGICTKCGTAASYSIVYEQYTASKHKVIHKCSVCGRDQNGSTQTESHSFTSYSTYHKCKYCGYTANHASQYGTWLSWSSEKHYRTARCSVCGYSTFEYEDHKDANNDGRCDVCGYTMSVFSVTVPASLELTVSKDGEVYTATGAAVINNSTGAVEVTSLTVSAANGWTLVPYSTDMASAKVDSKLIGFTLNGASTTKTGSAESLALSDTWTIAKSGSLPMPYDAVVSATSTKILSQQVLSIVFIVEWADA